MDGVIPTCLIMKESAKCRVERSELVKLTFQAEGVHKVLLRFIIPIWIQADTKEHVALNPKGVNGLSWLIDLPRII